MITRVVKMTFKNGNAPVFREVFNRSKFFIRGFEGCKHLSLLESQTEPNVFFTYSKWENESYLDLYRNSDLFKSTWAQTKVLFEFPAQAWTCHEEEVA
jgi:heme-degrading monooxygenase HmoA